MDFRKILPIVGIFTFLLILGIGGVGSTVWGDDDDEPIPPLVIDPNEPPPNPLSDDEKSPMDSIPSLENNPSSENMPELAGSEASSSSSSSSSKSSEAATEKSKPAKKKLSLAIFKQIGKLSMSGKKKDPTDYFLYCIGELDLATQKVDVRFDFKMGQQETADFLAEYLLTAPEKKVRKWMLLSRFKTATEAETALASTRKQYDDAVAYRDQMRKIYRATTIRRC